MMSLFSCSRKFALKLIKPKIEKKILDSVNKFVQQQQERNLNVQEHVAYTLLKEAKIATPQFGVAKTSDEAFEVANKLDSRDLVVKAQVLTGSRGIGEFKSGLQGGVRLISSAKEAKAISEKMIGQILVTPQTGLEGKICKQVMICERKFARREFYFCVAMERTFNGPVIIASSEGGVSIEEVAAKNPDSIKYIPIDIMKGLSKETALSVAKSTGFEWEEGNESCEAEITAQFLLKLYELFTKKDALLIEINPYAEDVFEDYFALDAKFLFDDSAEFRQKELFQLRDVTQEDPNEMKARDFGMNYITLDGNIGCMVNGAGLAMATMDIIKLYGGEPANFLDVGGSATVEAATNAFKMISDDKQVRAILVNIFGGIMRCDLIAEAVISAIKTLDIKIPVIVRLKGNKVEEAEKIIAASTFKIVSCNELEKAAKTSVHLARIVDLASEVDIDVSFDAKVEKKETESCKK